MMVRLESVSKWYRSDGNRSEPVLHDVSLNIPAGQFICILGPSGCGKTTLLNLVAGFIKPSRGSVFFNDSPVREPGPDRAVVFQDANLFPWLTVLKNVEFGLRLNGADHYSLAETAGRYLDLVGMGPHKDALPHTLSGGMRQRTAIARALALEPKVLLMDEPFSSLDANAREHLQDELLKIWQYRPRTLIYITHSVEEASYLADRVIVMGPSPNNIYKDMVLKPVRPRERLSIETQNITAALRASLDTLTCRVQNTSSLKNCP